MTKLLCTIRRARRAKESRIKNCWTINLRARARGGRLECTPFSRLLASTRATQRGCYQSSRIKRPLPTRTGTFTISFAQISRNLNYSQRTASSLCRSRRFRVNKFHLVHLTRCAQAIKFRYLTISSRSRFNQKIIYQYRIFSPQLIKKVVRSLNKRTTTKCTKSNQ